MPQKMRKGYEAFLANFQNRIRSLMIAEFEAIAHRLFDRGLKLMEVSAVFEGVVPHTEVVEYSKRYRKGAKPPMAAPSVRSTPWLSEGETFIHKMNWLMYEVMTTVIERVMYHHHIPSADIPAIFDGVLPRAIAKEIAESKRQYEAAA